jgi:hypothetical protein
VPNGFSAHMTAFPQLAALHHIAHRRHGQTMTELYDSIIPHILFRYPIKLHIRSHVDRLISLRTHESLRFDHLHTAGAKTPGPITLAYYSSLSMLRSLTMDPVVKG